MFQAETILDGEILANLSPYFAQYFDRKSQAADKISAVFIRSVIPQSGCKLVEKITLVTMKLYPINTSLDQHLCYRSKGFDKAFDLIGRNFPAG